MRSNFKPCWGRLRSLDRELAIADGEGRTWVSSVILAQIQSGKFAYKELHKSFSIKYFEDVDV